MEMNLRAGIVGCGVIGEKRLHSFPQQCRLTACCDSVQDRATRLAAMQNGARVYPHWQEIVTSSDVDVVFVATTHNMLAPVTYAAVTAGKHVLVEKPAARSAAELMPVLEANRKTDALVRGPAGVSRAPS